jgi:hypothetical protein
MIDLLTPLMGAVLGALLYRERGLGRWNTTIGRLIWAVPTGLLIAAISWSHTSSTDPLMFGVLALTLIAAHFLTMVISGHGAHFDMGRLDPAAYGEAQRNERLTFFLPAPPVTAPLATRWLVDALGMAIIGLGRGILICLPLITIMPVAFLLALVAAHAFQPVTYSAGWLLHERFPDRLKDPIAVSELLTGAVIWGVLVAAA